jgi:glycosyltransferase involved in cell wall biosynthesis
MVYSIADAFMPVGIKGHRNFRSYGIKEEKIFIVPYTIQEKKYYPKSSEKKYDLMFCGQLIDRKMPMFFCRIAEEVKRKLGTVSLLILGKGPMEEVVRLFLEDRGINYEMPGFIQQDEIPVFYQKSRIFLFPSKSDGWGVVANEACAAGLPVITCDQTGAANDLIQHNYNGFVLDLDEKIWVEKILFLLTDTDNYNQFSTNSLIAINSFSIDVAAKNAMSSFNYVMKRHGSEKK